MTHGEGILAAIRGEVPDSTPVMFKNLNQADIGGPECGSWKLGLAPQLILQGSLCLPKQPGQGLVDRPFSGQWAYPRVVLLIGSNTRSFRPPDDDSRLAFHPTESGAGRLQRRLRTKRRTQCLPALRP
jgi:hypothetical protein